MSKCQETLRETELALEQATNDIEVVRSLLRKQIMIWRDQGVTWWYIKRTPLWEAYRRIGGS